MNEKLGNTVKFIVFVGLGFGILYLVYRNQQAAYLADCALRGVAEEDCSLIRKVLRDFRGADFGWLALAIACYTLSNLSRAIRWNMMLRSFGSRPRLDNAFLTIALGYFANLGFPRLGEIARPAAMARYENISLERVIGTVVVGRILDVISLLIMTAMTLYFGRELILNWVSENADFSRFAGVEYLLGGVAVLGVVVLALAYFQRERIAGTRLGGRALGILEGFVDGLGSIARVDNVPLYLFHSVNIWFMYYWMNYSLLQSFAPAAGVGLDGALTVFVSGGWGIVVPSPGGMGSYHFMTSSALGLYGVAGEDGFSWANIGFFTINIGSNVIVGLIALLALPRINRNYDPPPPAAGGEPTAGDGPS